MYSVDQTQLESRSGMKKSFKQVFAILFLAASVVGCAATAQAPQEPSERQKIAMATFNERCKKAGEFIHRTVNGVEGIFLLKVRPADINLGNQYALDDPYGSDMGGEGYIESFLRGSYEAGSGKLVPISESSRGYLYVEAIDAKDGKRYRYTGRIEEPWQKNKSYLQGYLQFVVDRTLASSAAPRYGVAYEDISTRDERDYWIAGSSLKVIDLQTNEVLGERVGYMVDPSQGSRAGGRSPWLLAANYACPAFGGQHASSSQIRQTERFVQRVLKPKMP